ncbi:MAG: hypothetical protein WBQ67_12110 [Acinetobacter sp.]|jgi:hypothetical protein
MDVFLRKYTYYYDYWQFIFSFMQNCSKSMNLSAAALTKNSKPVLAMAKNIKI